jgi:DNA-binding GntR family transcriptional regulator
VLLCGCKSIAARRHPSEPIALEQSVGHADDEWEARVVAAHHRLERAQSRQPATSVLHKAFRMTPTARCPSSRMIATCSSLFDLAER